MKRIKTNAFPKKNRKQNKSSINNKTKKKIETKK